MSGTSPPPKEQGQSLLAVTTACLHLGLAGPLAVAVARIGIGAGGRHRAGVADRERAAARECSLVICITRLGAFWRGDQAIVGSRKEGGWEGGGACAGGGHSRRVKWKYNEGIVTVVVAVIAGAFEVVVGVIMVVVMAVVIAGSVRSWEKLRPRGHHWPWRRREGETRWRLGEEEGWTRGGRMDERERKRSGVGQRWHNGETEFVERVTQGGRRLRTTS
jgi:hypothetical protein